MAEMPEMPAETHVGSFQPGHQLIVNDHGPPYWTTDAVAGTTVLVIYSSSSTTNPADRAPTNDELVIDVPTNAISDGAAIEFTEGRYQRGGAVLSFASTSIGGTLNIVRADEEEIRGYVSLVATSPSVDLASAGDLEAEVGFRITRETP